MTTSPNALTVGRLAGRVTWRSRAASLLALTLLYLAAGGWIIRGILADPSGTIPGWPGDNFYFLWQLVWVREAILAGVSPLWAPHIFFPEGFHLARDDMTLLNTLPGALLGGVVGDALAYNLLLLLSSTLSGLFMALWVRRLTGSLAVGAVCGLAFVLLPFRVIRHAGHLDLVTTWPLPFTLLFLDRALADERKRDWALAGLGFALTGLGAWYFAPFFALALPGYALVRGGLAGWRRRRRWVGLGLFALVAGGLLLPAALPYLLLPGGLRHPIREALKGSASPTDYVVPSVLHPLWGEAARAYFASSEFGHVDRALSPGFVVLALATLALLIRRDRTVGALLTLGGVAFLFSLGPALQWAGQGILVPWPPALGAWVTSLSPTLNDYLGPTAVRMVREGTGFIPLPALAVSVIVPFGQAIRAWSRFGIVVDVALIALAGLSLAWLARRWRLALPVAALLVLGDLAVVPLETTSIAPRPVDRWLRAHDDGAPIIVLPVTAANEPREMWATLHHRRTIVHGHATHQPPTFRAARSDLAEFPSAAAIAVLKHWGVRQVVLLPDAYGPAWPTVAERLAATAELRRLAALDGAEVWEIR
ncbi:MAG: hypothetical protein RMM58_03825 [Chloroflexota bacterium]|nr:hypothetical protein [Dehalococcoidia bacterium]MDW8252990.1 hypothetical protein [Chloroflexota bacterium]